MSSCRVVELSLSSCRAVVELSSCRAVELSSCRAVELSSCRAVELSSCRAVELSSCRAVELSSCRAVELSSCRAVELSSCRAIELSSYRSLLLILNQQIHVNFCKKTSSIPYIPSLVYSSRNYYDFIGYATINQTLRKPFKYFSIV